MNRGKDGPVSRPESAPREPAVSTVSRTDRALSDSAMTSGSGWQSRAPTREGQLVLLGIIFFFVFIAYTMMQDFSASLYGDKLGAAGMATLYAFFTAACFVAPAIANVLGPRLTLCVGATSYALLALGSLLVTLGLLGPWSIILVGAVNGMGSALFWTAQGRLMLQYADQANRGRAFAIFWPFFVGSAVVGGIFTFAFFKIMGADHADDDKDDGSGEGSNALLFALFFALVMTGAALTGALAPPDQVARCDGGNGRPGGHSEAPDTTLLAAADGAVDISPPQEGSWTEDVRATLALFNDRRIQHMAMIFWYTGFNQPYQLVTFGNRLFLPTTLGLLFALFYSLDLAFAFVSARILDGAAASAPEGPPGKSRIPLERAGLINEGDTPYEASGAASPTMPSAGAQDDDSARRSGVAVTAFAGLSVVAYAAAAALEWVHRNQGGSSHDADDRSAWWNVTLGAVAYGCWGAADALSQGWAYWQVGRLLADSGPEAQAHGAAFYKMFQSAGWCIMFALSPPEFVPPLVQLAVVAGCGAVGTVLALLAPRPAPVLRDVQAEA